MAVAVYCTQTISTVYFDEEKIFSTTLSLVFVDFDCPHLPNKKSSLLDYFKGPSVESFLQKTCWSYLQGNTDKSGGAVRVYKKMGEAMRNPP